MREWLKPLYIKALCCSLFMLWGIASAAGAARNISDFGDFQIFFVISSMLLDIALASSTAEVISFILVA